jgi:hypothetical protein
VLNGNLGKATSLGNVPNYITRVFLHAKLCLVSLLLYASFFASIPIINYFYLSLLLFFLITSPLFLLIKQLVFSVHIRSFSASNLGVGTDNFEDYYGFVPNSNAGQHFKLGHDLFFLHQISVHSVGPEVLTAVVMNVM